MAKPPVLDVIIQAQAAYAHCIDEGRLEEWPDFFVEDDCHYKITTARNHRQNLPAGIMWASSRGMLLDRVTSLRQANIYEPQTYRHILGQPLIVSETNDGVRTETSFIVVRVVNDGPMDLFAVGRYLDVYRVQGDAAKLRERIVVCDSSRIDTLLAIPL
jgi:anthranilate 1,2-dioxygenase small subunit